jgi:RimJ/RimL family protein N-acetyltransferase
MAVIQVSDPQEAAARIGRLPLDAVLDNVLLTVLDTCVEKPGAYVEHHWWFVEEGGTTVGMAFHTPPYPIGLALEPGGWTEELADHLLDDGYPVKEVSGLQGRTETFARAWVARTGSSTELVHGLRLLECLELRPPEGVPGSARPVRDEEEFDEYLAWTSAFMTELSLPDHDPVETSRASVTYARWWLTPDGERVSMAAGHPPARGVSRIGPVYTPPEHRRRGYAAAVTADVTAAFYAAGAQRVVLYTDAANPTSNAVYERIGYAHVADGQHLRFVPPG